MKRELSISNRALLATVARAAITTAALGAASTACAAEAGGTAPMPAFLSARDSARDGGLETIRWQPVGDDVLASQTGKFANGQMISGFVLNLLSQWNLPNGASAIAQGSLAVAQNAANQMSATINATARVASGSGRNSGADPSAHVDGGQRIAVNGVSQVTQVAGNSNIGVNAAQIGFTGNALPPASGNGATSASASNANGTIRAGITFGNGGVSVALQTPAGMATQTIAPGRGQAGSIAQMLQIAGNDQQVANQLQLQLRTAQMSSASLRQAGVLQALQNAINARR
ncbi:peptidase C39 [Paraburkholderia sp. SARCC-3016]|uniref:peptidase C39 n=1 Tax=Paraburkholderia sp. SARCC-3016 TaxID=3058611 RepID=UPI00280704BE|nr:peptidase C39 [Paraburkholderia sp. SARCC-3016]MDQ7981855.1 peptidase C39 [Paraburkholderia sp. SARCC-3016]